MYGRWGQPKVKEVDELITVEPPIEASINNDYNYNGPDSRLGEVLAQ